MSLRSAGTFFSSLLPSIISDLRRIARRTRGETTVEDLQTEAWLVAEELSRDCDPPPDVEDKSFHQQILGRLYNRFVKFADKRLRTAVRIDEQHADEDGGMQENSIAATLTARDDYDPSKAMEALQEAHQQEMQVQGHFAEAVAYFRILSTMKNDRYAVADHLAIAVSTLHCRIKRAEWVIQLQPSLFDGITAIPNDFMPPRHAGRQTAVANTSQEHRPAAFLNQLRLFVRAYIPIRRL